jgi:hypothetical protein
MITAAAYDAVSGSIDALVWVASWAIVGGLIWVVIKVIRSGKRSVTSSKPTSIIIGKPSHPIRLNNEEEDFLDALDDVPNRLDGWFKDPSGVAELRYHLNGRWTMATVNDFNSEEEKTAALNRLSMQESTRSEKHSDLQSFLKGLPAPSTMKVIHNDEPQFWASDPLGRWAKRFNQGDRGNVGWTNIVLDADGVQSMDNLTTDELKDLDISNPYASGQSSLIEITEVMPSAGWFVDPTEFFCERFWSGSSWTVEVRDDDRDELTWAHTFPPDKSAIQSETPIDLPPIYATPIETQTATRNKEDRVLAIANLLRDGMISRSEFDELKFEIFGNKQS